LLLSVRAFLAIAAPPLILRYCSCFLRLRLASLLSVPLALANRLPHLQQVACDACRLTVPLALAKVAALAAATLVAVPLALANGLPRLQLVHRDACRLQKDTAAGQHRF
jgi:phage terminase Nu1 subunit (DNA packaging protein)